MKIKTTLYALLVVLISIASPFCVQWLFDLSRDASLFVSALFGSIAYLAVKHAVSTTSE